MRTSLPVLAMLGLLVGCTSTEYADGWSYIGFGEASPRADMPLAPVLFSFDDAPGLQGLLYTAMVEAEVAKQYATHALANRDDAERVRGSIGEILYALGPELAPDWSAKETGIVSMWAGAGFGLLRALDGMREEIEDAGGRVAQSELTPAILECLENTERRSEQLATLGRRFLDGEAAPSEGQLEQILVLAKALNQGAEVEAAGGGCGLARAKVHLDRVVPENAAV
jgi:hypothetical protein